MNHDNVLMCIWFVLSFAGAAVGSRWSRARRLIDETIGDSSVKRTCVGVVTMLITGSIVLALSSLAGRYQDLIAAPIWGLAAGLIIGVFQKPLQW